MADPSALVVLSSVVIGGLLGIGGQLVPHLLTGRRTRRIVASSIAAEIAGYLDIVSKRQHVQFAEQILQRMEEGEDIDLPNLMEPDETPLGPFVVMNANLANLGYLGDHAADVVKFYTMVTGVRTTLISAARGRWDNLPLEARKRMIRNELEVWREAEALGRRLSYELVGMEPPASLGRVERSP